MQAKTYLKSIALLTILFLSLIAHGQRMPTKPPEERAKNQVHWMEKNLGTTPEQNERGYEILLKYFQDYDNAIAMGASGRQKHMEKQGLINTRNEKMKKLLSSEQYQKYQQHIQEMNERSEELKSYKHGGF